MIKKGVLYKHLKQKGVIMKYLIASDVHGSYYYAKKIIDLFNQEKADKILLLGDILYHGPRNDLPR